MSRYYDLTEPDWESIAEARAESRADADLERAEDQYDSWLDDIGERP